LQGQLAEIEDSLGQLTIKSQGLTASLQQLGEQLTQNEQRVAEARMSATVNGTDLSTGALDAYWRAAVALQVSNPNCAIPWWAIAGVGRTESKHGTYRGASLGRDGLVSPPIFGPELDGSNSFAIVRDSDGGALDGTATTDRAVGPMQFLPSSWKAVARDATGDGIADPQNLYDAALTAGVYLCRKGPGLNQEGPLRAAYLSYNRSQRYVDIVMSQAFEYQRSVPLA
jgi:membrane-bound lytic murein transglycosylase B